MTPFGFAILCINMYYNMGLMDVGGWFTISLDMTRARHLKNFDFRRLPKASDEMDHNPISQKFWHHKLQVDEPLLLTSFILSMPLFFPCLFDKFFFFGGSFIGKSLTGSYCLYVICKKKPPQIGSEKLETWKILEMMVKTSTRSWINT